MPKYVIIGSSAGGIGAVEAIREVDPEGELTVISEESYPLYSRPMISEYVSGEATLETMKSRSDQFWKKNNVNALTGKTAVNINFINKQVELDGGEKVDFEKLLIATGGKPFIPKIEGGDKDGVFTFTELSSAKSLESKLEKAVTAVVIGGGLIGVSVAEALVKRGIKVTIVELKKRILNQILDEEASVIAEDTFRKAGVNIVNDRTVQRILGRQDNKDAVAGVVMTDGREISCDLVVVAIGVAPRIELVEGTSVRVNLGIVVDRFMQTNIPDIYACGDVVETHDFLLNRNRFLPLWPLAHLGGRVAGYNMAGKKAEFDGGTIMSSLKYFKLPIISVGLTNPEDNRDYEVLVEHQFERTVYKKIILKNGFIVGFIFLGDIEKSGIIFHLMKNGVNVDGIKGKLLSEDFGLLSLPESVRKELFVVN